MLLYYLNAIFIRISLVITHKTNTQKSHLPTLNGVMGYYFQYYLMKVLVLCLFVVAAFSLFSEDLTKKYSIEVLQQGEEGTLPKKGDKVKMHYAGTLKDGTEFDSSYKRNSPLPLSIGSGQVIKCWDEVGLNMEVGTKVKVLCPSDTAYGSRGVGPIPANSDLIFVIERVE